MHPLPHSCDQSLGLRSQVLGWGIRVMPMHWAHFYAQAWPLFVEFAGTLLIFTLQP